MKLTSEQESIIAEARTGKGDILIEALAGCAKTTTLLKVVEAMPQRSVLFAAFNKGIADEAEARKPKTPGRAVVVQTLHAIGRSIIVKHFPNVSIDNYTPSEDLVRSAFEQAGLFSVSFEMMISAVRLLRCAKETLSIGGQRYLTPDSQTKRWLGWSQAQLAHLGLDQRLFHAKLNSAQIDRVVAVTQAAIMNGLDVANRESVDFCDLIWLPEALDLAPPSRYQAIVLDEVQDVSEPQLDVLRRVALPNTRWIAAGDSWQQLYSWRGSLGAVVWSRFNRPGTKTFPLTMTWRCSKAVVAAANELVPKLRAQPDAEDGTVSQCTLGELPFKIGQGPTDKVHTFVLSRLNAPLLDCALFLWRAGVKFQLNAGKNLLDPLFTLIDRELDLSDRSKFCVSLNAWHAREAVKASQIGSTSRREQIDEQRAMLLAAVRYAEPKRVKTLLRTVLSDKQSGVRLSSVHQAKGLEAERVFLLKQTFFRHVPQHPYDDNAPPQEELNIEYVAITRAKTHVIWVDIHHRDRPELLTMPVADIPIGDLDVAFGMAERAAAYTEDEQESYDYAARAEAISERMG